MQARWATGLGFLVLGLVAGFLLNSRLQVQAEPDNKPASVIPREFTSYRNIVKEALPAVVSIEVKSRQRKTVVPQNTVGDGNAAIEPTQGPKSDTPLSFGSGVLVDPKGIILTNYHVVEGADALEVRLSDGRRFAGKDWRADRKTDLAIVRIESDKPLPCLQFGDSDLMEVGDRVLAIGAPFGLTGSVTHGIISAKSRNIRLNQYEDFLQTDAAINPGNSGGPLINMEGKVIGINSAIKSKSGGFQGVGLAISSNLASAIMRQLQKDGVVHRGYLGVKIRDIDAELAARLGVKEGSGVMVTRVFDQSPAAKAGIKVSDVILSIGGNPVRDSIELQKAVNALTLRQPAEVQMFRDCRPLQLKLVIEEQPEEFGLTGPKKE